MELSEPVKKILSFYESDNPGTKVTSPGSCCTESSVAPGDC